MNSLGQYISSIFYACKSSHGHFNDYTIKVYHLRRYKISLAIVQILVDRHVYSHINMDTVAVFGAVPLALFVGLSAVGYIPQIVILPLCFFVAYKLFVKKLRFIGPQEQLVLEGLTDVQHYNGPCFKVLPLLMKSDSVRQAITLGRTDYCIVQNTFSGAARTEEGPKLLFLEPYDEAQPIQKIIYLRANQFARMLDKSTGAIRVEIGEQGRVVPNPNEVKLDSSKVRESVDLKANEYIKIEDKVSGEIRIERGEKVVFLGKYEEFVGGKEQAWALKVNEWVKVEDQKLGTIRTEKGEKIVWLGPMERFVQYSKQKAIEVDENTSVLIRNNRSGQQSLITEKQAFFPGDDEDVMEVRNLYKLADYEAMIVRDVKGGDKFFFGKNPQERAFFLPPYSEVVQLVWSKGRRRDNRSLRISKVDLRPQYMNFEFNCRTSDNVELILEGSFFWQIENLQQMIKVTNDTTGDVCNHARSKFIEKVSRVTLQEFMVKFNMIAEEVHQSSGQQDTFYSQRGVLIHSLEVTGYKCAEQKTEKVLSQIIMETTNRMNRLQKQESENEVHLQKIHGDVAEEESRSNLLTIQAENSKIRNSMEGQGESEKVIAFLKALETEVPELPQRIDLWSTLRKQDALEELAQGNRNSKLYFTPKDCNIRIENHERD